MTDQIGYGCEENGIGIQHDRSYGTTHAENETELSWPIRLGAIYDKNKIIQQRVKSYMCDLRQKQN